MRTSLGVSILVGCVALSSASPLRAEVIQVPDDFGTIQEAVDFALPGDKIHVAPGDYAENVVVEVPDIRIMAPGGEAVLDGMGLGGIGIHVLGTETDPVAGVEIKGFVVRSFERGIVLEAATDCVVRNNEVHDNLDLDPDDGLFNMADGIVLIGSAQNTVRNNFVHDNGHNGVFLLNGSSENVVRNNLIVDNGVQTGKAVAGCGIQLSGTGANDENDIVQNRIRSAAWGILLGPGGSSTGNFVGRNQSHDNRRAGIAILGENHVGNTVRNNNATGNGLLGLEPSLTFDLFEDGTIDNEWIGNLGTSSF